MAKIGKAAPELQRRGKKAVFLTALGGGKGADLDMLDNLPLEPLEEEGEREDDFSTEPAIHNKKTKRGKGKLNASEMNQSKVMKTF